MEKIPLEKFDEHISGKILDRGLSLYYGSFVRDPTILSPAKYEFVVEGGDDYTVYIHLEDNEIVDYACNCPYDYGPICKHIAAALYYLDDNPPVEPEDLRSDPTAVGARPKTASDPISAVFERASKQDLQEFIQEQAEHNSAFRSTFLLSFAHLGHMESTAQYSKQVKELVNSFYSERYGYYSLQATAALSDGIYNLLEASEKNLEAGNGNACFCVCTAVMEELTLCIQHADDSGGYIADSIQSAAELFQKLARETTNENLRKEMFEYCLKNYDKRTFRDWPWEENLLFIGIDLLTTEEEREELMKRIKRFDHLGWGQQTVQEMMYRIYLKMEGEKEALDYMEQHPDNSVFLEKLIQKAIDNKNYERAKQLAREAAEEEEHRPFRAKAWIEWLLNIAEIEKDTPNIIKYANRLFYMGWGSSEKYYQLLKDTIGAEGWSAFVEQMIEEIQTSPSLKNTGLLSKIYIQEEYWERLMEKVRKEPTLSQLERYEQYLAGDYSAEFIEMYREGILNYLQHNVGRKYYQTACNFLKRMIRLGGEKEARDTIAFLRTEYTRRPALLEELTKV